jgi:hypothetical protein
MPAPDEVPPQLAADGSGTLVKELTGTVPWAAVRPATLQETAIEKEYFLERVGPETQGIHLCIKFIGSSEMVHEPGSNWIVSIVTGGEVFICRLTTKLVCNSENLIRIRMPESHLCGVQVDLRYIRKNQELALLCVRVILVSAWASILVGSKIEERFHGYLEALNPCSSSMGR